jgi:hypothetical protein
VIRVSSSTANVVVVVCLVHDPGSHSQQHHDARHSLSTAAKVLSLVSGPNDTLCTEDSELHPHAAGSIDKLTTRRVVQRHAL